MFFPCSEAWFSSKILERIEVNGNAATEWVKKFKSGQRLVEIGQGW